MGSRGRARPSSRAVPRRGLVDRCHARVSASRPGCGPTVTSTFRVRSAVRPWEGTFADVDRAARSLATSLQARGIGPGDVVMFQLPNWVEAGITFWAAAYLGAVVIPVVHFYGAKEIDYIIGAAQPDVIVTADRFGHTDYLAMYDDAALPPRRPAMAGRRRHGRRQPCPPRPPRSPTCSTPSRSRRPIAVDPDSAGAGRVHLRHHQPPQGRRALAPHHRLRDPPARPHVPDGRAAPDHRHAGRPLHRDAQRVPAPAAAGPTRSTSSTCGTRPRCSAAHARGGPRRRRRRHLLPHQPARPPRLHRRAPRADALRRARRFHGPGGGYRAGDAPRHQGLPLLREHRAPLDHGVHARRPEDKRLTHRRTPAGRRGDPPRRRRRDLEPGPGPLHRLHRPRARRRRFFDDDGWYRTGDVGVLDADGYLTITDRVSDIIIRGGENISAQEIEELLLGLDAVAEVGVVAAPDERLGEHAAAVIRTQVGAAAPTLEEIRAHLAGGRPGPPEVAGVALRGGRLPTDGLRQDPEVPAPPAAPGGPADRWVLTSAAGP